MPYTALHMCTCAEKTTFLGKNDWVFIMNWLLPIIHASCILHHASCIIHHACGLTATVSSFFYEERSWWRTENGMEKNNAEIFWNREKLKQSFAMLSQTLVNLEFSEFWWVLEMKLVLRIFQQTFSSSWNYWLILGTTTTMNREIEYWQRILWEYWEYCGGRGGGESTRLPIQARVLYQT